MSTLAAGGKEVRVSVALGREPRAMNGAGGPQQADVTLWSVLSWFHLWGTWIIQEGPCGVDKAISVSSAQFCELTELMVL